MLSKNGMTFKNIYMNKLSVPCNKQIKQVQETTTSVKKVSML